MNKTRLLKKVLYQTYHFQRPLAYSQESQKNHFCRLLSSLHTRRNDSLIYCQPTKKSWCENKLSRKTFTYPTRVTRRLLRSSGITISAKLDVSRNICGTSKFQVRYNSDIISGSNGQDPDESIGQGGDDIIKQGEELLEDETYINLVKHHCGLPGIGHRVFILQIVITDDLKHHNDPSGNLQLSENVALVKSIPYWKVVDCATVKVKSARSVKQMVSAFNKGAEKIKGNQSISAVFISTNYLRASQMELATEKFRLPIFNRTFILTQVFKAQARTKEAKLHVALAELPLLRFCVAHGFQIGQYGLEGRKKHKVLWQFNEYEKKVKAALLSLEKQRLMVRTTRSTRQIPTIAVIGYTNCGKTTLIKALTGDDRMIPQDRLFATLDVTAHGGALPNNMTVVFMDTVGFIMDLPHSLKRAFTATLEDTLNADLIVHVRDLSHPYSDFQKQDVLLSLEKMLPESRLNNMIEVYNKIDKLDKSQRTEILSQENNTNTCCVSAVTGEGMEALSYIIQTNLLQNLDYLQKKIRIPQNGTQLGWLYKEATVVSVDTVNGDEESLIVSVYISKANYQKFVANFAPKPVVHNIV